MKRIFTLLALGLLCFALNSTKAQSVTNFNSGLPTASCWTTTNFKSENNGGPDATNAASTKGQTTATLTTPFIDIPAGGTIKFDYIVSKNTVTHTLVVRLISLTGNTVVSTLAVNNTTYQTYTSPALTAGTYRVAIEYTNGATTAIGQHFITLDNLTISGANHYINPCNLSPTAAPDIYTVTSFASPVATVNVLANDTDPNNTADPSLATKGERLSVTSFTTVSSGTIVLNPDNTFTFTPNASFTGGTVTFNYTVTDNGYTPLTATATVTISYPTTPQAINDNFGGPLTNSPYSNTVTPNDVNPDTSPLMASVVAGPATGSVVLNTNGSFTYTPPTSFSGGPVTFTYKVTYTAYSPLYSNTATVTINYPALTPTPLPVKLLSFTGQAVNNQAQLNWQVDDNETGRYFKVEKSLDGNAFTEAALLYTTGQPGKQGYSFTELLTSTKGTFYRLKIVNDDASVSYSKTVLIKPQQTNTNESVIVLKNPIASLLRFNYNAIQQQQVEVNIYMANGIRIGTQSLYITKGNNYIEIDASALPKGMYILEVNNKTTPIRTTFMK